MASGQTKVPLNGQVSPKRSRPGWVESAVLLIINSVLLGASIYAIGLMVSRVRVHGAPRHCQVYLLWHSRACGRPSILFNCVVASGLPVLHSRPSLMWFCCPRELLDLEK